MRFLRQSTSVTVVIGPFIDKADGLTARSDLFGYSVNTSMLVKGGTAAIFTPDSASWTSLGDGYYTITLTTTDTNTVGMTRLTFRNDTYFLPVYEEFHVVKADTFDALFGTVGLNNIADAVLCRDMAAARSQSVFTVAARSLLNAISLLRNRWFTSGTTMTVTTEDDTTTAWTATTTATAGTNPITSVDPA